MFKMTFPPNLSPTIQPYSRTSGLAVGSPIVGTAVSGRPTLYQFDASALANGDYELDITNPLGRALLRKSSTDYRLGSEWWEFDSGVAILPSIGQNLAEMRKPVAPIVEIIYVGESFTLTRLVTKNKQPVSLIGKTLVFVVEAENKLDRKVIPDNQIARFPSPGPTNQYAVTFGSPVTDKPRILDFVLRDASDPKIVYDKAKIDVQYAPSAD